VQGRIHNSSYEKDGQKKHSTEIICEDLYFAGGRDRASASSVSVPISDELMAMAPTNGGYNRRPAEMPADEIAF
jgi:single-stranded DNA-binding protein